MGERELPPFSMFSSMVDDLVGHFGEKQFRQLGVEFHALRFEEEAQMERILADPVLKQAWKPMVWKLDKNDEFAANLRLAGNKAFHAKQHEHSLKMYNTSVLFASHPDPDDPSKGKVLPVAYFNRGVASLQLGDFENALKDLYRAEETGYPASLKYRLLDRKATIFYEMKRYDEAEDLYEAGLLYLLSDQSAAMSEDLKKLFRGAWEGKLKRLRRLARRKGKKLSEYMNEKEKTVVGAREEDDLPSAEISGGIRMQHSKAKGRHFVALRDFEPGDVLVVEKPFASVLDPKCWDSHCLHCFKRVKLTVPCPTCCLVNFCCEHCRDNATEAYHKIECSYVGSLIDAMLNDENDSALLAQRLVILAGLDKLNEVLPNYLAYDTKFLEERLPDLASTYENIVCLQSHVDKISPDNMMKMALQAYYLTRLLEEHGYFDSISKSSHSASLSHEMQVIGHP